MNFEALNWWARAAFMSRPETWDQTAVDELCATLCEHTIEQGRKPGEASRAYGWAKLEEEEEAEIKERHALAKQAHRARAVLQPVEQKLRLKSPFFADMVEHIIAVANARMMDAEEAEREGIYFLRGKELDDLRAELKSQGGDYDLTRFMQKDVHAPGRRTRPTTTLITELAGCLDAVLRAADERAPNARYRRIAQHLSKASGDDITWRAVKLRLEKRG